MLSRPRRPGRRLGRGPRPLAIGSRRRAPAPRGVDEPGIAAMAAQGQRRLVAARGVVGCLFVGLLVLFALALAVRYVVAVVRGLSLRPPDGLLGLEPWQDGGESPRSGVRSTVGRPAQRAEPTAPSSLPRPEASAC